MLARTPAVSDEFSPAIAPSGASRFAVAADSGESRRRKVHEAGSLRVRFPNAASKAMLDAVIVNTAGGMTGGDRFDIDVEVGAGARPDRDDGGGGKNLSLARAGHRSST